MLPIRQEIVWKIVAFHWVELELEHMLGHMLCTYVLLPTLVAIAVAWVGLSVVSVSLYIYLSVCLLVL